MKTQITYADSSNKLWNAICEILDEPLVTEMTLSFGLDRVPSVTLTRYLTDSEGNKLAELLKTKD